MIQDCDLETERLEAFEWHARDAMHGTRETLDQVVASMLTESVTTPLPAAWHGHYTLERARRWIAERDAEGTTLLVVEKESRQPIGLLLRAECPGVDGVEVRLGYLIAEAFWRRGYASELVAGLVKWCREQPSLVSVASGVAASNQASARVLEKNGFHRDREPSDAGSTEAIWRLAL